MVTAMRELRDFQREDVDFIKKNKLRCLIANAPGTGKTATTLSSLIETHRTSLPAVIVCPASVAHNWAKECRMWAPGIRPIIISDMSTPVPVIDSTNVIYIISWSLLDARTEDLIDLEFKTLVADEAHFIKNSDALRSQAFQYLVKKADGILLLTGTPIINAPEDMRVLKDLFGTEEPPMIRRLLEDVAKDIPPKSRSYVYVKLREEDQKEYTEADKNFQEWLKNERLRLDKEGMTEAEANRALTAEALAKIGYLRRLVGEAKTHAAVDWIARAVRIGEPVVVFVEHQATLRRIERALRKARILHGIIEGSTSIEDRQAVVDGFQNHRFPVFLGTKAAKEGITLTAARHLMFVERFFTSAEEEQAEDRIRRIGQLHPTTIWFLHAVDTVDERIDTIVKTKRHIIREAIGAFATAETSTGNVEAIVSLWDKHTSKNRKIQPLGHGDVLPPLPLPRDTYAIVFSGKRWKPKSALVWCKMNGYEPKKRFDMGDEKVKLIVQPPELFTKGSFSSFEVCSDIKILKGKRISKANERRILSTLRRVG